VRWTPGSFERESVPDRVPYRRIFSFASLPLISAVAPLLLIPVVSSVGGSQAWAAVALGQALGAGAATILQYGWGFVGPPRLISCSDLQRGQLLWLSTLSRLFVAALLMPAGAVLAGALAPTGHAVLAAVTALAFSTFGLSGLWFFVGIGRAGLAAMYETIPRLVFLAVAAAVVWSTGNVLLYPSIFLSGQIASLAWMNARLSVASMSAEVLRSAWRTLAEQRAAAGADCIAAVNQALPAALVAAVAPGALVTFVSGERLLRLTQSGVQPFFNAFQGWVSEARQDRRRERMVLAVSATAGTGAAAGLVFALGVPVVDGFIFAGQVEIPYVVSSLFGMSLALFSLTSSVSFHVFAPAGRPRDIFRSALAGVVVMTCALVVLPQRWGAAGAVAALVIAQVATLVSQVRPWRRVLTR
jgi:O-antigen/teichoic acid export membrane protein